MQLATSSLCNCLLILDPTLKTSMMIGYLKPFQFKAQKILRQIKYLWENPLKNILNNE